MNSRLFQIILFFCVVGMAPAKLYATADTLSEQSRVTLFTCGPGVELYAGFGHSALWISDPETGIDRLYNYGTFDFNTPNFYAKFVRGRLDYMLSVTNVSRFLTEYDYRKISVTAQQLNLTLEERQRLYNLIETNYLPENRMYRYDFFYDNCATRLRDIVAEATNNRVKFNEPDQNLSFRQMLFPYLEHSPWTKFGINLILGLSSDKKATPEQYMYLPEKMQKAFATATIENQNRPLVESEKMILDQRYELSEKWYLHPVFCFSALLALVVLISFFDLKRRKATPVIDSLLFGISSLAGLFLLFMWVGTDHSATNQNLNIAWLLPAQVISLWALIRNKSAIWFKVAAIYQATILIVMFFGPQETELSFALLGALFLVRMIAHVFLRKK
jgi:hypothetical protein